MIERDWNRKCGRRKIRRPLLARGTKAAAFGLIVFCQSAVIASQAIRLLFYVFSGLKYPHDLHHQIQDSRSVFSQKNASFSSLCPRLRNSEKQLPRLPTNIKNRSPNSLKRFPCNVDVCNTFDAKRRFGNPKRLKTRLEIYKNDLETSPKIKWFLKHFEAHKLT